MSGRVLGLTDIDPRGDTLMADVAAVDTVLSVGDTSDFEEDTSDGNYWLVIADSEPLEYLEVDHEANTVTLASAAGAVFDTGDPVAVWDPSAPPAGAKVVEYLVSVLTDRGPVPAVIDHETTGFAGVDNLVDASVTLTEETDGSIHVDRIFGRKPNMDPSMVGSPLFRAYLAAPATMSNGIETDIDDWAIAADYDTNEFSYDAGTGQLTLRISGTYLSIVIVRWAGNSSGGRRVTMISQTGGVDSDEALVRTNPPDNQSFSQVIPLLMPAMAGTTLRVEVLQTSGAGLALDGDATGTMTTWRVMRLR